MQILDKSMIAGFVAAAVLSTLLLINSAFGLFPELNPIDVVCNSVGVSPTIAWVIHFMIGTIAWGGLFALLLPYIPGEDHWLKGVLFGLGIWMIIMVGVMPMVGAGIFGLNYGMVLPVTAAMLHVIFGAVLGTVFGSFIRGFAWIKEAQQLVRRDKS